jgi:hypothetical protein
MLVTTLTKGKKMTKKNDTTFFENKLLDFVTAKDPMLEMLQWVRSIPKIDFLNLPVSDFRF